MSSTSPPRQFHLRELLRHGGVFGVGMVLSRLTSIILLPVYTHVLGPTDYGVLAVLDIVAQLLGLAIGTGLISAAGRWHFQVEGEYRQSQVWWTALLGLSISAAIVMALMFPVRAWLAAITFGPEVPQGPTYYLVVIFGLWFGLTNGLLQNHLRVMKRSQLFTRLALVYLLVNAGVNVIFLYYLRWGVAGVIFGNFVTGVCWTVVHLIIFIRIRGGPVFDWGLFRPMTRFGLPLVGVALLSAAMHQLDRYVLIKFVSLHDIGLYSLAYQIGQGVNSLVLVPFSQIWSVMIFEIAKTRNAFYTFVEIFRAFTRGLLLVLLAASLGARLAVSILSPPEYMPAADLIPIIALAYFFFSLDDHFRVPALVHNKTVALLPVYIASAVLNLGLNLLLVPRWGIAGAAWASAGTFVGFAVVGLIRYRQVERFDYPIRETLLVLGAAVGVYAIYRLIADTTSPVAGLVIGGILWVVMAVVLLRRPYQAWRNQTTPEPSPGL